MKATTISKAIILGLAMLLATTAFAASNKGPLQLTTPVNVAGKQLAAGDYTVKWDGSGSAVQVSIMKGKNVVATVSAQVVDLPSPSAYDSAVVTNEGAARNLQQIRFSGKKFALQVSDGGSGSSGSSSN